MSKFLLKRNYSRFLSNFIFLRLDEVPEDGINIYGLFIEGAQWSIKDRSLIEQLPKVVINTMPMIHFKVRFGFQFNLFSLKFQIILAHPSDKSSRS